MAGGTKPGLGAVDGNKLGHLCTRLLFGTSTQAKGIQSTPSFPPHSFDSTQLPVYLKVKPEVEDHRQLFSTKFAADHYIPLFALIALASDKKDLDELLIQYKYDE